MIVDQFEEVLRKTTQLFPLPTATASAVPSNVAPIPTVCPNHPIWETAGSSGKKTLWVVFALMLIASASFTALAWKVPVTKRLYHVITTTITVIAALSYFAMATGHGVSIHHTTIRHQHDHDIPDTFEHIHRQVYWARYVDWSLTTPLLILDLGLLAGMSGAHIIMAILADLIMVLTGMFAAFGSEGTSQKWGWYTIGCVSYIVVLWHLVVNGGANATAKGARLRSFFIAIAGYTVLLWTAYPIVWGLADGSRKVGVDGEIIAYAVLDVLAKGVFGAWLLIQHANMPESEVELGGFWANGLNREGAIRIGEDDGA